MRTTWRTSRTVSVQGVDLVDLERVLRAKLEALGPAPRAELLEILTLADHDRAEMIGRYWQSPKTRDYAELLIDVEADQRLRAVLVGTLRDMEPGR